MTRLVILFWLVLANQTHAQNTIYVSKAATGANNGSSLTDAFVFLQDRLASLTLLFSGLHQLRVSLSSRLRSRSWSVLSAILVLSGSSQAISAQDILFDRVLEGEFVSGMAAAGDTLWAGGGISPAVYRSLDSGVSWDKVLEVEWKIKDIDDGGRGDLLVTTFANLLRMDKRTFATETLWDIPSPRSSTFDENGTLWVASLASGNKTHVSSMDTLTDTFTLRYRAAGGDPDLRTAGPERPGVLILGVSGGQEGQGGGLYTSYNYGENWEALIEGRSVRSAAPLSGGRLLTAGNRGIHYSDDAGLTWDRGFGGEATSLRVSSDGSIFAYADFFGLIRSSEGSSWTNLGHVGLTGLAELFLAPDGHLFVLDLRDLFRSSSAIPSGTEPEDPGVAPTGPHLFPNPARTTVRIAGLGDDGPWTLRLFDILGREAKRTHGIGSMGRMELADLTTGLYLYVIEHQGSATRGVLILRK